MFDGFLAYFNESNRVICTNDIYNDFILQLGGKMFGGGVFNSFSNDNLEKWTKIVNEAYPEFCNMFKLFGYDWLGRCFGVDLRDIRQGEILMFEIGTGDVLEIPCLLQIFLDEEIPLYSDSCLAESFFNEWMEAHKGPMEYGKCAGYKIPLFLGGEDSLANLEYGDMDVYWGVVAQMKRQILD